MSCIKISLSVLMTFSISALAEPAKDKTVPMAEAESFCLKVGKFDKPTCENMFRIDANAAPVQQIAQKFKSYEISKRSLDLCFAASNSNLKIKDCVGVLNPPINTIAYQKYAQSHRNDVPITDDAISFCMSSAMRSIGFVKCVNELFQDDSPNIYDPQIVAFCRGPKPISSFKASPEDEVLSCIYTLRNQKLTSELKNGLLKCSKDSEKLSARCLALAAEKTNDAANEVRKKGSIDNEVPNLDPAHTSH